MLQNLQFALKNSDSQIRFIVLYCALVIILFVQTSFAQRMINDDADSVKHPTSIHSDSTHRESIPTIQGTSNGSFSSAVYPSPCSSQTNLIFQLPFAMEVEITVMDVRSQVVREIIPSSVHSPGTYTITIDMSHTPSGAYFVKSRLGEYRVRTAFMKMGE